MTTAEAREVVARAMGYSVRAEPYPATGGTQYRMHGPSGLPRGYTLHLTEADCWFHCAPAFDTDPAAGWEMLAWAGDNYISVEFCANVVVASYWRDRKQYKWPSYVQEPRSQADRMRACLLALAAALRARESAP